ncbi:MAG TPA: substrate-binding domain-containing protein, partial [Burkholderiales bacterium]|nr:substrate-binding domain-containing protein [Burkholderiales bacterium]
MNRLLAAAFAIGFAQSVASAEIKVLSAGAIEPGLRVVAGAFQKATGHEVGLTFNTAPQIQKRIGEGEVHDVVIAPPALLDQVSNKLGQERTA